MVAVVARFDLAFTLFSGPSFGTFTVMFTVDLVNVVIGSISELVLSKICFFVEDTSAAVLTVYHIFTLSTRGFFLGERVGYGSCQEEQN